MSASAAGIGVDQIWRWDGQRTGFDPTQASADNFCCAAQCGGRHCRVWASEEHLATHRDAF